MVGIGSLERVRRMRTPFDYRPARPLVRLLLCVNGAGLVAALGMFSLAIWTAVGEYADMIHGGTQMALFAAAASVALLSLTGIIGLRRCSRGALLAFTVAVALVLAGQLSAICFYVGWRDAAAHVVDGVWETATPDMRAEIQSSLQCCGFRTTSDAPGPNCAAEWTVPCSDAINDILVAQRALITTLIVIIIAVEVASLAIAAYLLHILPTERDLETLAIEEEWLKSLGIEDDDEEEALLNGVY